MNHPSVTVGILWWTRFIWDWIRDVSAKRYHEWAWNVVWEEWIRACWEATGWVENPQCDSLDAKTHCLIGWKRNAPKALPGCILYPLSKGEGVAFTSFPSLFPFWRDNHARQCLMPWWVDDTWQYPIKMLFVTHHTHRRMNARPRQMHTIHQQAKPLVHSADEARLGFESSGWFIRCVERGTGWLAEWAIRLKPLVEKWMALRLVLLSHSHWHSVHGCG